jgi:thiol-disulfide isomerase/thioredoxin
MRRLFLILLLLLPAQIISDTGHEYAPLESSRLEYKDWTLRSIQGGESVNFSEWSRGKKLVLVVYFAPWCLNWKYQAPTLNRLHSKYKDRGFDIIAVSEYAPLKEVVQFFQSNPVSYKVVLESESDDSVKKTTHYSYRKAAGDKRRWGSPFNLFLDADKNVWTVNGELIEKEVDKFIDERLSSPSSTR